MAAVTLPTHYRNVFAELGYAQAEIDARIENTIHTIFYGDEAHRFYGTPGRFAPGAAETLAATLKSLLRLGKP